MVSTHLKNISQIESFPQVGVKITNSLKPPPSISFHRGFLSRIFLEGMELQTEEPYLATMAIVTKRRMIEHQHAPGGSSGIIRVGFKHVTHREWAPTSYKYIKGLSVITPLIGVITPGNPFIRPFITRSAASGRIDGTDLVPESQPIFEWMEMMESN